MEISTVIIILDVISENTQNIIIQRSRQGMDLK